MVSAASDPESIVWIASYPRSGNTFVRLLLANYFLGRFEGVSIHVIKDFTFGEHVQVLWKQITNALPVERDEKTEWLARDAYFNRLRGTTPPAPFRFVKTHTASCVRWGVPAFNFRPSDRVIYVVRNPLDVAVSLAAFHGWDIDQAITHMLTPYAQVCGNPAIGYEVSGSWNLHVHSWMQMKDLAALFVSYDDLLADPGKQLTRMLQFIGGKPNPVHVQNVAMWTQFDKLKAQEASVGFPEVTPIAGAQPFFRAGKSDQWRTALTSAQAGRIINACGSGMELIGLPFNDIQSRRA